MKVLENARFVRTRRMVNAVSVGLIVYLIAGGRFGELRFSTIGITIERPEIAISLIWMSLAYFTWRFLLNSTEVRDQFNHDRMTYLAKSKKYWDYSAEKVKDHPNFPVDRCIPYLKKEFFQRKLDTAYHYSISSAVNVPRGTLDLTHSPQNAGTVVIPYFDLFMVELKADAQAALLRPTFSEFVLPLFLVFFAVILGLWRMVGVV